MLLLLFLVVADEGADYNTLPIKRGFCSILNNGVFIDWTVDKWTTNVGDFFFGKFQWQCFFVSEWAVKLITLNTYC